MPQEFQVLRCFHCSIFQVHQVKKSKKWECKLCGSKQSIKMNYGIGTGKECRLHVQKLNLVRGEICERETIVKNKIQENEIVNDTKENSNRIFLNFFGSADENKKELRHEVDTSENSIEKKKCRLSYIPADVHKTNDTISSIRKLNESNLGETSSKWTKYLTEETSVAEEVEKQSIFSQNNDIDLDEILSF